MPKVCNPVTIVQSGSIPTLITKNITENGDYAASADSADGYSSVHVEVPVGETVYFSEYNAMPYAEKVTIPAGTYLENSPTFITYRNCSYLRELSCLRTDITSTPSYAIDGNYALRKVYLPYIASVGRCSPSMGNPSEPATAEVGSIGHPVSGVHTNAFGWGSGGLNWTVILYVNPEDYQTKGVYTNKPFGAASLSTLIYKSAVDGSTLETIHFPT